MNKEKLSVSDRNGRYLLVFSFISVVLVVLSKSIRMLESELSKIYISQSSIPYIKMIQAFPSILFVSCIFLLVVLIRYSYLEANIFVERADINSQEISLQKADKSYDNILYYLMIFGIGLLLYFFLGTLTEKIEIAKENYTITFSIVVILSSIISIVATRRTFKKRDGIIPHISTDVIGAIVFFLFCLFTIVASLPQQTIANLKIEYDNQYINMNFEGNSTFEEIEIKVNNEVVENIDGKKESFFISKYISKDSSTPTVNENDETDFFVEENNNYFYYTKTVDINDYIAEGTNEVYVSLEISGRHYMFSNPLIISDSKYKYVKPNFETLININK